MRKAALSVITAIVVPLLVGSCAKEPDAQPAQQPGAYPQQQPGAYPQQQPGAYPQQPAATAQPAPAATTPAAPAATAAPAGTMTVPGAMATACQADSACGFAKCNPQYQKCVFPCTPGSTVDCQAGSACMGAPGLAACVPSAIPTAPTQ
jgi:hypothetical protein